MPGICADHESIHAALLNWARWCRVTQRPHRCRSIEGRYRSPPVYHDPAPSNPPDANQAIRVEALIVDAPNDYGKHLTYHYIKRLPPAAMRKKLGLPPAAIDYHLERSRAWLNNHLTKSTNALPYAPSTDNAANGYHR